MEMSGQPSRERYEHSCMPAQQEHASDPSKSTAPKADVTEQACTCDALVVYHSKFSDARQHQVLDHFGRKRRRVQYADMTLLQCQLSALCTSGDVNARWGMGEARRGTSKMQNSARRGYEPPHRRMLRSLRSELVIPSGFGISASSEACLAENILSGAGQNVFAFFDDRVIIPQKHGRGGRCDRVRRRLGRARWSASRQR